MKSSLLMATFNGEKYIKEQLDSIRCQTKSPDEVIICDDCSIDNTKSVILKYIEDHQLNNKWRFIQNNDNLGFRKNFQKLISLAKNEVIFLCDQDDIWNLEKIEVMMKCHEVISHPIVLVSDVNQLLDKYSKNERVVSENIKEKKLIDENNNLFKIRCVGENLQNRRPGWSLSFSNQLNPSILKLMDLSNTMFHDEAIWYTGLFKECLYYVNKKTGTWRKFAGSETTRKKSISELKGANKNYFKHSISNLEVLLNLQLDKNKITLLQNEIKLLKLRREIVINGNLLLGIENIFKNKNIKQSSLDFLKSIIIRFKKH